ncbi:hypothetical protein [Sinorhizobium terangae]|uniref:hypothetical protein n=1 Tax=Sinorhizobium terangae TaxID=110322 RepID=UPI0017EA793F|nr:hypothetical protein [Sinorhizobium terangae]
MRMRIDDARHNDTAGCIDGLKRRNVGACGRFFGVDTGDPSLPDINGGPFVKRLAVTGDEASISDH